MKKMKSTIAVVLALVLAFGTVTCAFAAPQSGETEQTMSVAQAVDTLTQAIANHIAHAFLAGKRLVTRQFHALSPVVIGIGVADNMRRDFAVRVVALGFIFVVNPRNAQVGNLLRGF